MKKHEGFICVYNRLWGGGVFYDLSHSIPRDNT